MSLSTITRAFAHTSLLAGAEGFDSKLGQFAFELKELLQSLIMGPSVPRPVQRKNELMAVLADILTYDGELPATDPVIISTGAHGDYRIGISEKGLYIGEHDISARDKPFFSFSRDSTLEGLKERIADATQAYQQFSPDFCCGMDGSDSQESALMLCSSRLTFMDARLRCATSACRRQIDEVMFSHDLERIHDSTWSGFVSVVRAPGHPDLPKPATPQETVLCLRWLDAVVRCRRNPAQSQNLLETILAYEDALSTTPDAGAPSAACAQLVACARIAILATLAQAEPTRLTGDAITLLSGHIGSSTFKCALCPADPALPETPETNLAERPGMSEQDKILGVGLADVYFRAPLDAGGTPGGILQKILIRHGNSPAIAMDGAPQNIPCAHSPVPAALVHRSDVAPPVRARPDNADVSTVHAPDTHLGQLTTETLIRLGNALGLPASYNNHVRAIAWRLRDISSCCNECLVATPESQSELLRTLGFTEDEAGEVLTRMTKARLKVFSARGVDNVMQLHLFFSGSQTFGDHWQNLGTAVGAVGEICEAAVALAGTFAGALQKADSLRIGSVTGISMGGGSAQAFTAALVHRHGVSQPPMVLFDPAPLNSAQSSHAAGPAQTDSAVDTTRLQGIAISLDYHRSRQACLMDRAKSAGFSYPGLVHVRLGLKDDDGKNAIRPVPDGPPLMGYHGNMQLYSNAMERFAAPMQGKASRRAMVPPAIHDECSSESG